MLDSYKSLEIVRGRVSMHEIHITKLSRGKGR